MKQKINLMIFLKIRYLKNIFKRDWSKIKGFSCSSLATAFYIEIGAIKYNRNIHSVKPGDFQSNKNTLTFNDKFSFGPEKIIDFSVY